MCVCVCVCGCGCELGCHAENQQASLFFRSLLKPFAGYLVEDCPERSIDDLVCWEVSVPIGVVDCVSVGNSKLTSNEILPGHVEMTIMERRRWRYWKPRR